MDCGKTDATWKDSPAGAHESLKKAQGWRPLEGASSTNGPQLLDCTAPWKDLAHALRQYPLCLALFSFHLYAIILSLPHKAMAPAFFGFESHEPFSISLCTFCGQPYTIWIQGSTEHMGRVFLTEQHYLPLASISLCTSSALFPLARSPSSLSMRFKSVTLSAKEPSKHQHTICIQKRKDHYTWCIQKRRHHYMWCIQKRTVNDFKHEKNSDRISNGKWDFLQTVGARAVHERTDGHSQVNKRQRMIGVNKLDFIHIR